MSTSKRIPAPGQILLPPTKPSAFSKNKDDEKRPVFTTSTLKKGAPVNKPLPQNTATTTTDTFYSKIQKTSGGRKLFHCGRLNRVKQSLYDEEAETRLSQGMSDLRSVLPLFDGHGTNEEFGEGSDRQDHENDPSKATTACTPSKSPSTEVPMHGATESRLKQSKAQNSIIRQYLDAVIHRTVESSTSVVRLSRDERTKEIDLSDDFVRSGLLSQSHSTPMRPSHSCVTSPVKSSPNLKHRTQDLMKGKNI